MPAVKLLLYFYFCLTRLKFINGLKKPVLILFLSKKIKMK